MGPISNILKMLPGGKQMNEMADMVDEKQLDRIQAIIRGMTPEERADPKILNASRRKRIANGSGVTVQDVNQLVDRFNEAKKMMGKMAGQMGMPGLGGMNRSATKKQKNKRKGMKGKKGKNKRQFGSMAQNNQQKSAPKMPSMDELKKLQQEMEENGGMPDLGSLGKGFPGMGGKGFPGMGGIDPTKFGFPK